MCTSNRFANCPPLLDFCSKLCHTNSMNKTPTPITAEMMQQLRKDYLKQCLREAGFRQAIRDGLIERVDSAEWHISDNH